MLSRKEALAYLTKDGAHLRCFSRYGSTAEECAKVAYRMYANIAYHNGEPEDSKRDLNHLMGLVVNENDDVPYILREYRIPRRKGLNSRKAK